MVGDLRLVGEVGDRGEGLEAVAERITRFQVHTLLGGVEFVALDVVAETFDIIVAITIVRADVKALPDPLQRPGEQEVGKTGNRQFPIVVAIRVGGLAVREGGADGRAEAAQRPRQEAQPLAGNQLDPVILGGRPVGGPLIFEIALRVADRDAVDPAGGQYGLGLVGGA